MLLGWLLRGERQVDVVCRYTSSEGEGRVDLESVRISNVPISAGVVNFLIEEVVQPRYPGRWWAGRRRWGTICCRCRSNPDA